ncbi:replication initiator protein A [Burkholderia multivorans]|uniref:replication initiator protein A n=1 Tax=Burkholderia multivorans TaxID=87883 RepID=UPI0021C0ED66|nr:replication initiator protein A [Burkholderia multivorans]
MSTIKQESSRSLRRLNPGHYSSKKDHQRPVASIVNFSVDSRDAARSISEEDALEDAEQLQLFAGERLLNTWKPREDLHSLEFPLFSLQKGKDTRVRVYRNGEQIVRIIPSVVGAANIFDKDLLVYAATLICKAADANLPVSRRVRFKVRDFLVYTERSTGGASYTRIIDSCRRLKGTLIETNFDSSRPGAADHEVHEILHGYGLIEDYKVITYTGNGKGALEVELILSTWTYAALINRKILAIHPSYFGLGQGLERRLYDLAKKHCGEKLWWKIGLDKLYAKSGSAQAQKYFRRDVVAAMVADNMPEFHIALDDDKAMVIFFRCDRDNQKQNDQINAGIHRELLTKKQLKWYYALRRWDSKSDPKAQLDLLPN